MAAPVFHIEPSVMAEAGGRVSVTGPEARHAAQVVRLRVGEAIELVDGDGRRIQGVVSGVDRDRLDVDVSAVRMEPAPAPRIVVIQALPKGERGERAVEMMTEVGVDVIVPWAAQHCVTTWDAERAERGLAKWRGTASAAAKQARRARTPEICDLHRTDDLQRWIAGASLALALDESAVHPVSAIAPPVAGDIVLVVGPEGGLSDDERGRLEAMGARPARLGPTVLRTSTAGPVAASVLLSRTPRWEPEVPPQPVVPG